MLTIKKIKIYGLLVVILIFSSTLMATTSLESNFRFNSADTVGVLKIAEVMPEIEGGIQELYKKIKYPRAAKLQNVQGRVFVRFIVDSDGNVQEPEILRDIGAGCGEAAIKVIKQLKFIPGKQDGKTVSVYYTLPITFRLQS